jgi:predicted dienelactone hydrolase
MEWEVAYSLPFEEGPPRTIPVMVWYPTEAEHVYSGAEVTASPIYSDIFGDPEVIVDAAPAPVMYFGGYPVIAYSHGARGVTGGSYRLARFFASHGWLMVAPGHVGDRMEDGAAATAFTLRRWIERPLDVSAALDSLETLEEVHPLWGRANTEGVLLYGHSRGAYTAWGAAGARYDGEEIRRRCELDYYEGGCGEAALVRLEAGFLDPRVAAILPAAGDGHPEFFDGVAGRDRLGVPVLMMTAEDNNVGAGALFEGISTRPFLWLEIEGGCHELFNLGCGFTEDAVKFPIVTTYALAFGRRYLLKDPSLRVAAILEGTVEISSAGTLRIK